MNNQAAKTLRKIIKPVDPTSKKVYRRLKKEYNRVPRNLRHDFLKVGEGLYEKLLNAKNQTPNEQTS